MMPPERAEVLAGLDTAAVTRAIRRVLKKKQGREALC